MTSDELATYIDETLLKPDQSTDDYEQFLEGALKYNFAAVCIPPHYAKLASKRLETSSVKVCTVVGFPLGYSTTETKVFEAKRAFDDGASEIDMVANLSMIKSKDLAFISDEVNTVVSAVPGAVVKVIIECCYLRDEEKIVACEAVIKGGAHFVKTSTGFGPWGAKVEDVELLHKCCNGRIKVKAAGGIKKLSDTLTMIDAGADRIGTSSGIKIVEEFNGNLYC